MPLSTAAIASFALVFAFLAFNMWATVCLGLPRPQPDSGQASAMRRAWIVSGGAFAATAVVIWTLALTVTPGLLSPL